jgi:hypothetical protein
MSSGFRARLRIKDILDLLNVIGMDALGFAVLKEPPQPLVPETPNHWQ